MQTSTRTIIMNFKERVLEGTVSGNIFMILFYVCLFFIYNFALSDDFSIFVTLLCAYGVFGYSILLVDNLKKEFSKMVDHNV